MITSNVGLVQVRQGPHTVDEMLNGARGIFETYFDGTEESIYDRLPYLRAEMDRLYPDADPGERDSAFNQMRGMWDELMEQTGLVL